VPSPSREHREMRGLAAAVVAALVAGCSGGSALPALGQPCSLLCATGLTCSAQRFCVKSCHCDGGPVCSNSSLATGCPPASACVAASASGDGTCAVVCADAGCPLGEAACASAPDGTRVCVGPDYPWVGSDGGVYD
jgi:hypothetical protein